MSSLVLDFEVVGAFADGGGGDENKKVFVMVLNMTYMVWLESEIIFAFRKSISRIRLESTWSLCEAKDIGSSDNVRESIER